MEIEIVSEKQNPLLSRKEITFKVKHPKLATPKRADIRDKLVAKFDTKKESSYIVKIAKTAGKDEAIGTIHVYDTPKMAKKIEPRYIIYRNDGKPKETPKSEE